MVFACVNEASQVAEDPVWPARSQAGRSHRPFQESLWVSALFCGRSTVCVLAPGIEYLLRSTT